MATLTEMRTRAGYRRLDDFASFAKISSSVLRRAEAGEFITPLTASRIAQALGIPETQLDTIEGLNVRARQSTRPRKQTPDT